MIQCPACRSQMPENALTCPHCGGSYRPDGRFETPWDVEMARMAAERERKVERAEAFGKLGRPHPHFFLEGKSGGCMVGVVWTLAVACTLVAALAVAGT